MDESNSTALGTFKATEQISKLSHDVLQKILSSMNLKAAISTSILSSEWRNLWKSRSSLSFTSYDVFGDDPFDVCFRSASVTAENAMLREGTSKFIELVNKVLQCHVRTGVEIFRIQFFLHKKHTNHLDEWIKFALESGSKQLHLMLSDCLLPLHGSTVERYDFPCDLLSSGRSSSLKHLFLQFCSLHLPSNFCGFHALRVLELDDIHINERDFHSILSICSVLERLRIVLCDELVNLQISSPKLEYLAISYCCKLRSIELSAINLRHFEYEGLGGRISFNAVNAPQLSRSSIYLPTFSGYSVCDCLIRFATDLPQLETVFLFFECPIENVDRSLSYKFTNLRHMVVFIRRKWLEDLFWLVALINTAPFMKRFHLHFNEYIFTDEPGIARQMVCPPKWQHNHLREVLITGFSAYLNQLQLVLHILENSSELELTIDPRMRFYAKGGNWVLTTRGEEEMRGIRRKAYEHLSTVFSNAKVVML